MKKGKMNNADLPWERQMLYIFRHWEEMHERVSVWKKHVDTLSLQLLEERKLRKKASAALKQVKRLCMKRDAELQNLRLRLMKSVEKNRQLSEALSQKQEKRRQTVGSRLSDWARRMLR